MPGRDGTRGSSGLNRPPGSLWGPVGAGPTLNSGMPGKKPLMRSLGEFFGHIRRGVRAPLAPPAKAQVIRQETREHTRDTPSGKVVLRRTTIEEIELRPEQPGPG